MAEPAWKRMVETLQAREFQSPYLDRLSSRMRAVRERKSIEEEIIEEMADALIRAEDKVNLALLELDVLDAAWADADAEDVKTERANAFNTQWNVARRAIWEFRVHREAIGLFWTRDLDAMYPLPRRKKVSRADT